MAHRRTDSAGAARELLQELGDLTGRTLDQIKLHQARVELAAALQRQVLAAELPDVPYLRAADRYTPARIGLDIGGDWFDGSACRTARWASRSGTSRATTSRPRR